MKTKIILIMVDSNYDRKTAEDIENQKFVDEQDLARWAGRFLRAAQEGRPSVEQVHAPWQQRRRALFVTGGLTHGFRLLVGRRTWGPPGDYARGPAAVLAYHRLRAGFA